MGTGGEGFPLWGESAERGWKDVTVYSDKLMKVCPGGIVGKIKVEKLMPEKRGEPRPLNVRLDLRGVKRKNVGRQREPARTGGGKGGKNVCSCGKTQCSLAQHSQSATWRV